MVFYVKLMAIPCVPIFFLQYIKNKEYTGNTENNNTLSVYMFLNSIKFPKEIYDDRSLE